MINFCSACDIAFDDHNSDCPLCEAKKTIEDLEEERDELKDINKDLKNELEERE